MSLDVSLHIEAKLERAPTTGVFVRENGANRELTPEEVLERFPDWEPRMIEAEPSSEVFSHNITHNLTTMADAAGIYKELWRPEELGITKARQLIAPLADGLRRLKDSPEEFRKYNPSNGWGTYEGLVMFVEAYLAACEKYPEATVTADR